MHVRRLESGPTGASERRTGVPLRWSQKLDRVLDTSPFRDAPSHRRSLRGIRRGHRTISRLVTSLAPPWWCTYVDATGSSDPLSLWERVGVREPRGKQAGVNGNEWEGQGYWGPSPGLRPPSPKGERGLGDPHPAFGHPLPKGEGFSLGRVAPAFGHPLPEGEGFSSSILLLSCSLPVAEVSRRRLPAPNSGLVSDCAAQIRPSCGCNRSVN